MVSYQKIAYYFVVRIVNLNQNNKAHHVFTDDIKIFLRLYYTITKND